MGVSIGQELSPIEVHGTRPRRIQTLMIPQCPHPTLPAASTRWWTLTAEQALHQLDADPDNGLTDEAVAERTRRFGRNELAEEPPTPLWTRIFSHFNELVVWILLVAAAVSALIGDLIDMAAILAIVVLNVAIGVFQEERASRALAALRKLSSPVVRVIRRGSLQSVPARDVVPGDVVELEAGDNVPADVRLFTTYGFRTQEAALTGESVPVEKAADRTLGDNAPLADRSNMAFMGTAVVAGRARAAVVATGMTTELGQIAGLLQRYDHELTPLQRRLAGLGRVLIVVCLVVVAIVFALNLSRGGAFLEVLLLSISLAVAAVPEGLPAVVTLTLAVGLQRMVKRHALIRRLPSVETLGAVTIICSDKTGTLTRNEMTVREIYAGRVDYQVTGTGYEPRGTFRALPPPATALQSAEYPSVDANSGGPESRQVVNPSDRPDLIYALTVAVRCNEASLHKPADGDESWSIVGDPTEGALLVVAAKAGVDLSVQDHEKLHEIPFDSDRKAMSVVLRGDCSRPIMYTKGAPEVILAKCSAELLGGGVKPFSDARRDEIQAIGSDMASRALRVLALAYREHHHQAHAEFEEDNLVFAGLVGMIDPPRDEAILAVRRCRDAGIRPVMITGDHPETALAIARATGIAQDEERYLSGAELDELSDDDLARDVASISVYARVLAQHKLRVVEAWQRRGDVVAMTGDGVNDAPAVKAADIGVAMGLTGSDITKETADMVLTDDNFASIVSAVEEGRGIFDNIQKFVHYLLSCNAGEVLLMLIAGVAGWPAPLSALQILWINLVTDGLPALALGMEPPEHDVMQRAPRSRRAPVINWARGFQILRHGLLMAATAAVAFWWIYQGDEERLSLAQSSVFCVVASMQLFYSLSCRSQRDTMPEIGLFTNPYLLGAIVASALIQFAIVAAPVTRAVFGVQRGVLTEWPMIAVAALIPVTAIELTKLARRGIQTLRGGLAAQRMGSA